MGKRTFLTRNGRCKGPRWQRVQTEWRLTDQRTVVEDKVKGVGRKECGFYPKCTKKSLQNLGLGRWNGHYPDRNQDSTMKGFN